MGAVYRATDQKFGTRVAIKETFYGDTDLAEAFEREARLLNGLHHPILPHVSDYFTEDGGHFLVMEYIDGEDLSAILKRGVIFPPSSVIHWAIEILDGLDYLHSQDPPVIHRDIKPNNLKLTPRGKIVLLDFGMAKETSSNTLGARSVFGYSRRYSPLEQIEGSGTDARSDIFSLGASMYHLLTGEPPVDVLSRASAIVGGRPDPLVPANVVNPDVPEPVGAILNTALALNAENRYASASAMSEALERIADASMAARNEIEHGHIGVVPVAAAASSAGASSLAADPVIDDVVNNDDVAIVPEPAVRPVAAMDAAPSPSRFNAGDELRRRLRGALPASVSAVNFRRPSRHSYAVWVPVALLLLGVVLFGTYRGFQGVDSTVATTEAPAETVDTAPAVDPAPAAEAFENSEVETEVASDPDTEATEVPADESPLAERKGPVATRRSPQRVDEPEPVRAKATETAKQPVERRVQDRRAGNTRPRRVVRPAFEQPSVSSIEAIMTGVPYERRRRSLSDEEIWMEDQRRRRRIRRMMRERPF